MWWKQNLVISFTKSRKPYVKPFPSNQIPKLNLSRPLYIYILYPFDIFKSIDISIQKNTWSFRIDESGKTSKILFKSLYFGGRNNESKWYLTRPFYIFILYPSDIYHNFADIYSFQQESNGRYETRWTFGKHEKRARHFSTLSTGRNYYFYCLSKKDKLYYLAVHVV